VHEGFVCGAIVGAVSVPATHPIDVVKTNMMAYKGPHAGVSGGMFGMARAILVTEGAKAFFKGMGTRCARVSSEQAFTFMFYDQISMLLEEVW
jgi:hypothetical protein